MTEADNRFRVERLLPFRSLGAGTVEVFVRELEVGEDVLLQGELTWETWERVWDAGSFLLDDEDEPEGFEDGRPVHISLRLRDPLVSRFVDHEGLLTTLLTDDESDVRHTEAWLATDLMQDVAAPDDPEATLRIGIRTSWAGPELDL